MTPLRLPDTATASQRPPLAANALPARRAMPGGYVVHDANGQALVRPLTRSLKCTGLNKHA
jgi:hypothetical protein